eukprot:4377430-Prymnesium_polylepis.1
MPQWIEADRSALNSLLVGGNKLVRIDTVPDDSPIGSCVTARRLKIDQANGELDKFKSRHAYDGKRMAAIRARLGLPPAPTGTCNIIDDCGLKCLFGDIAMRNRFFAKADIGDAYMNGTRARSVGYMRMPETIKEYDDDDTEMVIRLVSRPYGLHEGLLAMGWRQCPGVPAMYYFNTTDEQGNEHDCRLVKIVDDLGFSESDSSQAITKRTVAMLTKRYGKMTHDLNPSSFAGYRVNITRSATHTEVCLSQEQKVVEAARKYLPELLDGITPTQLLTGKQLEQALDNLALPVVAVQKMTQRIIGDLKYFERGSMPRLTRMVHRLSCVMGFPPASGLICAQSVLAVAYEHRHDTITFGTINASSVRPPPQNGQLSNCLSHGAPAQLECSADAALAPVIVYSILLTFAGASIAHVCKKIGTAVGSTHDAENIATVKASELLVYARVVLKALGVEPQ